MVTEEITEGGTCKFSKITRGKTTLCSLPYHPFQMQLYHSRLCPVIIYHLCGWQCVRIDTMSGEDDWLTNHFVAMRIIQ